MGNVVLFFFQGTNGSLCKKEIEQYEDNLRNLCFPVEFRREFTFVPSFQERYPLETLSRSRTNNFFFFFTSKVYSIERRSVSSAMRTAKKQYVYIRKTTTLHVHHAFFYISLPSLHDYDMKISNFTRPLYAALWSR